MTSTDLTKTLTKTFTKTSRIKTSRLLKAAATAALLSVAATGAHADPGAPFADFGGSWSGAGSITIAGGNEGKGGTERIRCRAQYNVTNGGKGVQQSMRCASDSYRFDLKTNVTSNGNNITGSWGEESRGVNGTLQGQIAGKDITAFVETNAFAATFNMTTSGNRQSIAITSKGDIRAVNISLTKSK